MFLIKTFPGQPKYRTNSLRLTIKILIVVPLTFCFLREEFLNLSWRCGKSKRFWKEYLSLHFCEFFAMRRRFQRPFCNISCIFNSSKHLPIAKKWQLQREGVLTNCNQAKSDGKVVSTKAFASSHKKQFIGQFQLILVLVGSLRILTHSKWQLH